MKSLFIIMIAAGTLCCAVGGFAAGDPSTGKITKINGNEITVVNQTGAPTTLKGDSTGLKVGDSVTIKGGKIIKGKATEVSPKLNPQPEPPGPIDIKKSAAGATAVPSTPERPRPPKQGGNIGAAGKAATPSTPEAPPPPPPKQGANIGK